MNLYSATLPYLIGNLKVFDIIQYDRFLFWNYWRYERTCLWKNEEKTKLIVSNFNLANIIE